MTIREITEKEWNLLDKSFSELHDCDKCHGKIVEITVDMLGVERCGYCNEVVDYSGWFKRQAFIQEGMKNEHDM